MKENLLVNGYGTIHVIEKASKVGCGNDGKEHSIEDCGSHCKIKYNYIGKSKRDNNWDTSEFKQLLDGLTKQVLGVSNKSY